MLVVFQKLETSGMEKDLGIQMANFVVVENGIVKNFIVADSFESAEENCGVGKIVVETEETGVPHFGGTWDGQKFGPAPVEEPVVVEPIE